MIASTTRDLYLTESETESPIESPLVGVDVIMSILQFSCEDTSVKTAQFHKSIHARSSSYIHEKIGRNQNGLLSIRQIAIE